MLGDILAFSEPCLCFLSDISPKDARFDRYKRSAEAIASLYVGTDFSRYAERIEDCGRFLGFGLTADPDTGEMRVKLNSARFCRCRHCILCQSRRVLMWAIRMYHVVPRIIGDNSNIEFIFLTLTVRNCPIAELRETLTRMNKAWERLTKRRQFPGLGFLKSIEITRSVSEAGDTHPHIHALIAVPKTYFTGRNYIKQEKWAEMWRSCLRADYVPIVHVRKVRPKKGFDDPVLALSAGVVETAKYTVKPEDLASDRDWLLELTKQMNKVRAIAVGGLFRDYLKEDDPGDLISEGDAVESSDVRIVFDWRSDIGKYISRT